MADQDTKPDAQMPVIPLTEETPNEQHTLNGTTSTTANASSKVPAEILADYDLSKPITSKTGLRQGLAGYGESAIRFFWLGLARCQVSSTWGESRVIDAIRVRGGCSLGKHMCLQVIHSCI